MGSRTSINFRISQINSKGITSTKEKGAKNLRNKESKEA